MKNSIMITATVGFILYWIFIPRSIFIPLKNEFFPQVILNSLINPAQKTVYLTFDDSPFGASTNRIVEQLNKYDMEGTFFVISDYVDDSNRQVLIDAVKSGHQLCNHGKTNSVHLMKDAQSLGVELETCEKMIEDIYREAGVELPYTKFYRPGCGAFGKTILDYCEKNNYKLTLGTVYPQDTISIVSWWNYIYLKMHIQNGDIVIIHDRMWTPAMLDSLLKYMKENNIVSKKLDDILL